jgi:hypothetical protein
VNSGGDDPHVMKARCRCQILSVELGAPSCANGGLNRDTLLEARHQFLIERHYADTRRLFADIRQHCSASWRIVYRQTDYDEIRKAPIIDEISETVIIRSQGRALSQF